MMLPTLIFTLGSLNFHAIILVLLNFLSAGGAAGTQALTLDNMTFHIILLEFASCFCQLEGQQGEQQQQHEQQGQQGLLVHRI